MAIFHSGLFSIMKYAVIAPQYDDTPLPNAAVAATAMASALGCDPLVGNVSAAMLRQHLRDRQLDGVYFGGHAAAGELVLSGGERMSAAEFAGILANCMSADSQPWVFLAACDSDSFVHAIQTTAAVDVAASIVAQLPDDETSAIELNLAETLRQNGGDLRAAIQRNQYQMLPYFRFWPHMGGIMSNNRGVDRNGSGAGLYEQIAENRLAIKYQGQRIEDLRIFANALRADFDQYKVENKNAGATFVNQAQPPYNETYLNRLILILIVAGMVFGIILFVALRFGGA